jgi:hypothetical protein
VCLKEPGRELLINGEETWRNLRWVGNGEGAGGLRSFQATRERKRERERDIYRSRAAWFAKLPGRAQFSVAASPTMTTSFNGWMG